MSAGEHPVSCICAIICPIIPAAIWDIILGIAFVTASVKTTPATAPKEAAKKYLAFEEVGEFIGLVLVTTPASIQIVGGIPFSAEFSQYFHRVWHGLIHLPMSVELMRLVN